MRRNTHSASRLGCKGGSRIGSIVTLNSGRSCKLAERLGNALSHACNPPAYLDHESLSREAFFMAGKLMAGLYRTASRQYARLTAYS